MPSVHFITYGCQMNVADSEFLAELLYQRGYTPSDNPDQANLVVVNTCSVRDNAETKALSKIRDLATKKKEHQNLWVIGCMAERVGEFLQNEVKDIDRVIGAKDIPDLKENIDKFIISSTKDDLENASTVYSDTASTFLSIMRGCNKSCSYCIVPYVRGGEISNPVDSLVDQAKKMISYGAKEITLLGQTVNSYKFEDKKFADLLETLHEIDGLERIRFTSSFPRDFSDRLIQTIADLPKVCKHIHIPVQSGSTEILKKMYRGYSREKYMDRINKMKELIPGLDLTTDAMVGFPGETEDHFQETMSLFRDVQYTSAFMFAYSVREGTKAAEWPDQIPHEVKIDRLNRLIELQTEITKRHYNDMVGKEVEVLITYRQTNRDLAWMGQDMGGKRVLLSGSEAQKGDILKVKVIRSSGMTLITERV